MNKTMNKTMIEHNKLHIELSPVFIDWADLFAVYGVAEDKFISMSNADRISLLTSNSDFIAKVFIENAVARIDCKSEEIAWLTKNLQPFVNKHKLHVTFGHSNARTIVVSIYTSSDMSEMLHTDTMPDEYFAEMMLLVNLFEDIFDAALHVNNGNINVVSQYKLYHG
jgi:hypothetical protein